MRFTPAATALFRLIGSDVGRPIADLSPRLRHDSLLADAQAVLLTEQSVERHVRGADSDRWFLMRGLPYRTQEGVVSGVGLTFVDITGVMRAEEAERRYGKLLLLSHDAIFVWRLDGGIETWNRGAEQVYGFTFEEAAGRTPHDLLHTAFPCPYAEVEIALRERGLWDGDVVHQTRDGKPISVSARLQLTPGDDGIVRVLEANRDITARKQGEQALHESTERYRSLFHNLSEGFALHEMLFDDHGRPSDYRFLEVNPMFERMTGLSKERVIGRTLLEVMPGTETLWIEKYGQVATTGEPMHFESHARELGRDYEVIAFRPKPGHFATLFLDITGRKRLERLYAVLSEVNEAIVRTVDGQTLLREVCRIVAEQGDFPLTWIGLVQDHTVVPAAWFGPAAESYLTGLRIEVDGEFGVGPTGTCIREDRSVVNDDFDTNPSTAPWRKAALERGFRASAAFPIRKDGKQIGALTLYATRPGAFDATQVSLLEALSANLSYALGAIEHEHRRTETEHALRASEARYRAFFAHLQELVTVYEAALDTDGRVVDLVILDANERHLRAFGLERESIIGRRTSEVFGHLDVGLKLDVCSRVLASGEPASYESSVQGRDFAVTLFRIDAKTLAQSGTEITERRRAEAALMAANAQLVDADRHKNEFLAILSHELRNPLAPIKNSLYVLERAAPGGEQARRAQKVIGRQSGQLARLVDDLLDVTRITRNKIQLQRQRLDLNEVVQRTLEDQRSLFEDSEVQLDLTPAPAPVFVNADSNRIAQVVGNLLQNAGKFTARGGSVRVSVRVESDQAEIRVADTGAGIAPELLNRLFEPFMQADATLDRSKGGLGLGLALVKGLIELHGGTVSAHSDGLGKGAAFTIRLPLEKAPSLPDSAASKASRSPPRRVLVIEDNVDAANSLRELLELGEHQVAVAYTGPDGIAQARAFQPDVILCDIGLPEMDGYQVARALRADDAHREAVLVALSGYALPDDLQRASDAGFDAHLAKPPSAEKIEEVLARATGGRH